METIWLPHFYRGKLIDRGQILGDFRITAVTAGLELATAERYFQSAAYLGSHATIDMSDFREGYSVIPTMDQQWILIGQVRRSSITSRGHAYPDYHCALIPMDQATSIGFNFSQIFAKLAQQPSYIVPEVRTDLPFMEFEAADFSVDEAQNYLQFLGSDPLIPDNLPIFEMLTLLLEQRPLSIINAPPNQATRLGIAHCLMVLLPPVLRYLVSFATEVFAPEDCKALLKFIHPQAITTEKRTEITLDWPQGIVSQQIALHPYALFLSSQWRNGITSVIETVRDLTKGGMTSNVNDLISVVQKYTLRRKIVSKSASLSEIVRFINSRTLTDDESNLFIRYLCQEVITKQIEGYSSYIESIFMQEASLAKVITEEMLLLAESEHGLFCMKMILEWGKKTSSVHLLQKIISTVTQYLENTHDLATARGFANLLINTNVYAPHELVHRDTILLLQNFEDYFIFQVIIELILLHLQDNSLVNTLINDPVQVRKIENESLRNLMNYWNRSSAVNRDSRPPQFLLVEASRLFEGQLAKALIELGRITIEKELYYFLDATFWRELASAAMNGTASFKKSVMKVAQNSRYEFLPDGIAAMEWKNLLIALEEYDLPLRFLKGKEKVITNPSEQRRFSQLIRSSLRLHSIEGHEDEFFDCVNKYGFGANVLNAIQLVFFRAFPDYEKIRHLLADKYIHDRIDIDIDDIQLLVKSILLAQEDELYYKIQFKHEFDLALSKKRIKSQVRTLPPIPEKGELNKFGTIYSKEKLKTLPNKDALKLYKYLPSDSPYHNWLRGDLARRFLDDSANDFFRRVYTSQKTLFAFNIIFKELSPKDITLNLKNQLVYISAGEVDEIAQYLDKLYRLINEKRFRFTARINTLPEQLRWMSEEVYTFAEWRQSERNLETSSFFPTLDSTDAAYYYLDTPQWAQNVKETYLFLEKLANLYVNGADDWENALRDFGGSFVTKLKDSQQRSELLFYLHQLIGILEVGYPNFTRFFFDFRAKRTNRLAILHILNLVLDTTKVALGEDVKFEDRTGVSANEVGKKRLPIIVTGMFLITTCLIALLLALISDDDSEDSQTAVLMDVIELNSHSSLALFYAANAPQITNFPPNSDSNTFVIETRSEITHDQWTLGDWDGDNDKTPGVYRNGVFSYTNDDPKDGIKNWAEIQINQAGDLVVGHFDEIKNNDCVGVIVSSIANEKTAYAMYFTCDYENVQMPQLRIQQLNIPDFNFGVFSGEYNFAAGDWDGDGKDTIAVQSGQSIIFSNSATPSPSSDSINSPNSSAVFDQISRKIQNLAGPIDQAYLISGDLNNDGREDVGFFYPNQGLDICSVIESSSVMCVFQAIDEPQLTSLGVASR